MQCVGLLEATACPCPLISLQVSSAAINMQQLQLCSCGSTLVDKGGSACHLAADQMEHNNQSASESGLTEQCVGAQST